MNPNLSLGFQIWGKTNGMENAKKAILKPDLLLLAIPIYGIAIYAAKKLWDLIPYSQRSPNQTTIKAQTEAAIKLIITGKEHGAKRLEVTLDQEAAIDIGSKIEGIPIKIKVGKSGSMTLKVEY